MILTARRAVTAFAAIAVPASLVLAGPAATASPGGAHPHPGFTVRQIVKGFPPNYLGMLGPWTGHVSRVTLSGPRLEPQGLLFLPAGR
jgi:hypothetical protein